MTNTIPIYSYNPTTGQYVGQGIAQQDPLESAVSYLMPTNSTSIAPDLETGQISSWNGTVWINNPIPASTLLEVQTTAINQVKTARDTFRSQNVTVAGTIYAATDSAKTKLNNKLDLGNFPTQWSDINDNIVNLTKAQATAVLAAMIAQDDSAYLQSANYITQIKACTTLDQVSAITIHFS